MTRMTNNTGLHLAVAVWLAVDEYVKDPRPNVISATGLIKPLRQIILSNRVPVEERTEDISERISSALGHTLHRGIEHAWLNHSQTSLAKLGYPKRVINAIRINPEKEEPGILPVYTEFRTERRIVVDGVEYIVSGQVDLIIEGRLVDAKSTKVWAYQNQKSVEQWELQGSIYRWLNPEKIVHDELVIQYLLLDWSRAGSQRDANYPVTAAPVRTLKLLPINETEKFIHTKLSLLQQYRDAPEADLPECTEEDLWRDPPVYKYYASGQVTARSTKNFDGPNAQGDAQLYLSEKRKGIIVPKPGMVKRCNFCAGFDLCSQKDRYIADGSLAAGSSNN